MQTTAIPKTRKPDSIPIRRLPKYLPARQKYSITTHHHHIQLGEQTQIMGIVNCTPDSFSEDGCYANAKNGTRLAIEKAKKLIADGADIIDIGGESTRPGSKRIRIEDELKRTIPTIRALSKIANIPISADTYKSTVAKHALDAGASIINNIKGVRLEKSLLRMVRNYQAAIVLMHIRGTPRTMQQSLYYHDLIDEIVNALRNSIEICLEIGIKSDKIIIDPGIGFGKNVEHNCEIINRLSDLKVLNRPVLIGTSRKSFIGKILNKNAQNHLPGTLATVVASIINGAHIIRVHDVKKMKEAATVIDAIMHQSSTTH